MYFVIIKALDIKETDTQIIRTERKKEVETKTMASASATAIIELDTQNN